jgi:hypothetical protein
MLEKDCGDGTVKISMLDKIIIAISILGCLSACGKSEIDKCVDSIMLQKYDSHRTTACLKICKNFREWDEMSEDEQKTMVQGCVEPCLNESRNRDRDDVKQYIRVNYEADIRLQCLRASSGNK